MSAENSSVLSANFDCSIVLLDVAGTTTSIDFVKDTLFKYVVDNIEAFLKEKWEDSKVKEAIKELKDGAELDLSAAVELVKELTGKNSDNKGLKALQGMLYEKAYASGNVKAHVFQEVPACLESWSKARKVAVYSTGSVASQKLLFANTTEGDLSSHISQFFDQSSVGPKSSKESYEKIAKQMDILPSQMLFVSDNVEEIKAAKLAGLNVCVIARKGNAPLEPKAKQEYSVVGSFKDVTFENPAKRKIAEPAATAAEEPPTKVAKTETTNEEKTAAKDAIEAVAETMEVDAPTDKKEPEQKTEEPTVAEKTESEPTTESMDTTEETKEPTTTEAPKEEAAKEEKKEKVDEETKTEKVEEAETKTEKVDEPVAVVEEKVEEEAAEKKEENKEVIEKKDEKVETIKTAVVEAKEETDKPVVEEEKEKKDSEPKPEKTEEAVKPEADKPVEVAEEAKEEEKPDSNGTTEQNGKHEEEKENNAELANGIENGKQAENGDEKESSTTAEEQKIEDASEIKVKKLDETVDSTPVAVEV